MIPKGCARAEVCQADMMSGLLWTGISQPQLITLI